MDLPLATAQVNIVCNSEGADESYSEIVCESEYTKTTNDFDQRAPLL